MTHKVFVSYHHRLDQSMADWLRQNYENVLIDRSLMCGYDLANDEQILAHIRQNHLKDSTVTIVLIGAETARRKWVDWEIYSSLRPYGDRTVNGLLGIYLPTAGETPDRLQDNIDSGYAVTLQWGNLSPRTLAYKIEEAYDNRWREDLIRNTRPRRRRNS